MRYILQDVRYAFRYYAKRPSLTLIAVMTLALGIGASGTIFGAVNAVLFKPLSFKSAQQLVIPWRLVPPGMDLGYDVIPWGNNQFRQLVGTKGVFQAVGAFKGESFNLTGVGEPALIEGLQVTSGFFQALAVSAALGRTFNSNDDRLGESKQVILSNQLWLHKFAGSKNIIGRSLDLNGALYTICGVMPKKFNFLHASQMPGSFEFPGEIQMWVPLIVPVSSPPNAPDELAVIARLSNGATIGKAQAQMNMFARMEERQFPQMKGWFDSRIVPLKQQMIGDTRRPLELILLAVSVVLLIACFNIASLLLAQSSARKTEFSTRMALGSSKVRLLYQLLTESLLLSIAGGGIGALIAIAGIHYIRIVGPASVAQLRNANIDGRVILFGFGVTLTCGFIAGIFPAMSAARGNISVSLKSGGLKNAGSSNHSLTRNTIVILEIALAFVLSISAGLLLQTFANLLKVHGGFNPESVLTFELSLPGSQYSDETKIVSTYHEILTKLQSSPGIIAAGLGETTPLEGAGESTVIRVPGRPARSSELPIAGYTIVSPEYFKALGTPLLQGRAFVDNDSATSMPVAIINQAMAKAYWRGENPVGKQVGLGSPQFPLMTIVGVVANIKHLSLRETAGPEMYVPYTQHPWPSMLIMQVALLTKGDPRSAFLNVERDVHSLYPDLPLTNMSTMTETVLRSLSQMRFVMLSVAAFAGLSLLLACIGIYGIISFSVLQRTREIGIRIALGAQRMQILTLIAKEGIILALSGQVIGLMVALAVSRLFSAFLYGVSWLDLPIYGVTCIVLLLVSTCAIFIPARRAIRSDPMIAFRHE